MSRRFKSSLVVLLLSSVGLAMGSVAWAARQAPPAPESNTALAAEVAALKVQMAALQRQVHAPELGQQMLELQMRHDRLWWAGESGNWVLAYYMVGELGESVRGIVDSNGDAAELQPQKLSEVMPSIMDPAIKRMQKALATQDKAAFESAYDGLSAACTACHEVAGNTFLIIQRPTTPLLDNLRYAPAAK